MLHCRSMQGTVQPHVGSSTTPCGRQHGSVQAYKSYALAASRAHRPMFCLHSCLCRQYNHPLQSTCHTIYDTVSNHTICPSVDLRSHTYSSHHLLACKSGPLGSCSILTLATVHHDKLVVRTSLNFPKRACPPPPHARRGFTTCSSKSKTSKLVTSFTLWGPVSISYPSSAAFSCGQPAPAQMPVHDRQHTSAPPHGMCGINDTRNAMKAHCCQKGCGTANTTLLLQ
mmetsp:Transcript_25850/g.56326  ORF Transcript_25850/g.56326 Transcript_25850/m.56326 type:complete len:227 (+) Transcript_25850:2205-2885(+)